MKARPMPELTGEQQTYLAEVYRTTKDVSMRARIQVGLLACEQHQSTPNIAAIVRANGCTISSETVRRRLAKYEIIFDQPQHTISSPDPDYIAQERDLEAVRDRVKGCTAIMVPKLWHWLRPA